MPCRSLKAIKGMLISINANTLASKINSKSPVFVFQYNPDKLTRTVSYLNSDGTIAEDSKVKIASGLQPTELIYLTLEIDAADQLEQPEKNPIVAENGLHPELAVLESMMEPTFTDNNQTTPRLTLFFWGPKRVLPVSLVHLKISEEAFTPLLNPIRVKIDLCMRRLSLAEIKKGTLGYKFFENYLSNRDKFTLLYRQTIDTENCINLV